MRGRRGRLFEGRLRGGVAAGRGTRAPAPAGADPAALETQICPSRGRPPWWGRATGGLGSTSPAGTRPSTTLTRCACSARPASTQGALRGTAGGTRASASSASSSAAAEAWPRERYSRAAPPPRRCSAGTWRRGATTTGPRTWTERGGAWSGGAPAAGLRAGRPPRAGRRGCSGSDRTRTGDLTLRKRSHYPCYATDPAGLAARA